MPKKAVRFFGKYTLRYDWEALEKMLDVLGATAFSEFDRVMARLGPRQLRLIIWAGLLHDNPDLDPKDVIPIINEYLETKDLGQLTTVVVKAIQEASVFAGGGQGEAGAVPPEKP